MGRVTRQDVADRAGTSTAVVSWVLNNGPRPVAAATKAKVLRAVEELGYEPDLIARALRSQRTNTLGCVVPDSASPFYSEVARSIEQAAFDRDLVLLLGNSGYALEYEDRYLRTFSNLRVDGLLLVLPDLPVDFVHPTMAKIPTVFVHNKSPESIDATSVFTDMAAAGSLAVEHLAGHGHREIACVAGRSSFGALGAAVSGWRDAMTERGVGTENLLFASDRGHLGGYEFGMRWLPTPNRPKALFAVHDGLAIGVLRAATELGLRVPGDIAVVSCNGTAEAAFHYPSITTAHHPIADFGEAAVATLKRVLDSGNPVPDVRLEMTLRIGGSCGCVPPALHA